MKNITDTLTPLMDKFRAKTGLTNKMTVARATSLMDHLDLHVNPNLLSATEYTVGVNKEDLYYSFKIIYDLPKAGAYTFSWKARTNGNTKNVRLIAYRDAPYREIPAVSFPLTDKLQSSTITVPEAGYHFCIYPSGLGEKADKPVIYYDCKLEVGDLATPLTTVGGVTKALLSALEWHFNPVIGGVA